jgi:hypothetical protein
MEEIDVARDIMDVQFQKTNDGDAENSYYLVLTDWTEDGMKTKMVMSNPLEASNGANRDGVQVKLKNPNLFISQATGKPLSKEKSNLPSSEMPRQLPPGVSEESIAIQAKIAFIGMAAIFITQVGLMKYLNGSIQQLMTLYFSLQMVVYMKIYNIPIPSNAEIYIEQFTKIVEFQFMSPTPIVQMFIPEWTMADLTNNEFADKM